MMNDINTSSNLDEMFKKIQEFRVIYDNCKIDYDVLQSDSAWKNFIIAESNYITLRNTYYTICSNKK